MASRVGFGRRLEEDDVGIRGALHGVQYIDIDEY